jgi:hypothetical protein
VVTLWVSAWFVQRLTPHSRVSGVRCVANALVVLPSASAVSGAGLWQRLSRVVAGLAGPQQAKAAPAPQGRVEVSSLRTRYSRTYRNPEGFLEAAVSVGPVNFQDAGGAWQPIDDTWWPMTASTTPTTTSR